MAKDHSGNKRGNLHPPLHSLLLYIPSFKDDCICHGFICTNFAALTKMRSSLMGSPRSTALSGCSTTEIMGNYAIISILLSQR